MTTVPYTKKGDAGFTGLVDCNAFDKHSPRIEAYGTVDELVCNIGYLTAILRERADEETDSISASLSDLYLDLTRIQVTLFNIGSQLSCLAPAKHPSIKMVEEEHVMRLEGRIDDMCAELPALTEFILPGGKDKVSAYAFVCTTVCRRAERKVVVIRNEIDVLVVKYLNRLSDYLFTVARYISFLLSCRERTIDRDKDFR